MSLFRKPKKPIQRRVFSGYDDEDEENVGGTALVAKDAGAKPHGNGTTDQPTTGSTEPLSAVAQTTTGGTTVPAERKRKEHRSSASVGGAGGGGGGVTDRSDSRAAGSTRTSVSASSSKANSLTTTATKHSLLSFDDEEEGEVFQVKKSSHSKKVMKSLDKERRRKRHLEKSNGTTTPGSSGSYSSSSVSAIHASSALDGPGNGPRNRFSSSSPPSSSLSHDKGSNDKIKREKCDHSSSNIQTEIRTDDFVVSWWSRNRIPRI
ncbi:uncharacterized protein LOC118461224 isoform X2 [Anopheles albimanus]|uniref:uncharacterized protein LOC118461224 isoform X2 n=1 Tax=Anopheles albimanus TaxID=7167 RepID=UPI00163F4990|nr:uncharacterized protein LOC118461224 isoform X2 [Anopheles albimanus]